MRAERRLELALEGQRFFDLRRWGVANATISAYVAGVGGGAEGLRRPYLKGLTVPPDSKLNFYPIPTVQLELSKGGTGGGLTQVGGW